ncbi:uncharacterized protein BCR38DRAFT_340953 [Pseudomassariella vexata]|uniref:Uncharacterized protein n=1 Tax=Pseudomassariella vexata TaxID=1141098 RepID=A0A1Y2E1X3_9PEZI|nr:uncharacterized protein BCR38DRAFT_340953 [Pseudomassariella vexata]ORY65509.1 hypothetical protein BCR38DRAFT_340953 [Pseudomassariella vexata]
MAFEEARDLRSAAQDPKRVKERNSKWSRGQRPSPGCNSIIREEILSGSESQRAKVRPERTDKSCSYHIRNHNIVKAKLAHDVPLSRSRAKVEAMEELADSAISRSLIDMLPSPNSRRKPSVSDNFLYNFDRAESPGKPLSLDIFVKTNRKDTEKFIEKEYEILDTNGDTLKGRKARQNLRRPNYAAVVKEPEIIEDDGFELV